MSETADIEQIEYDERRKALSKFLYYFAWAVEIVAVVIGLSIGLSMVFDGFQQQTTAIGRDSINAAGILNILVSALPFLMVAMVELTKIPFAEAYYRARTMGWRLLFLLALLFLSVITMESALNGFERTFASMVTSVSLTKNKTVELEETISDLELQRTNLASLTAETIEAEYNARQAQLSKEKNDRNTTIRSNIDTIRGAYDNQFVEGLKEQKSSLRQELESLRQRYEADVERINEGFENDASVIAQDIGRQQRNLRAQSDRLQDNLRRLQQEKRATVDGALFFRRDDIAAEFDADIEALNTSIAEVEERLNSLTVQSAQTDVQRENRQQIAQRSSRYNEERISITNDIREIDAQIGKANSVRDAELDQSISVYRSELQENEAAFQQQSAANLGNRDRQLTLLRGNESAIQKIDEALNEARSERTALRNEINQVTAGTQVYRLAQWFHGEDSAADLSKDDVLFVAMIWFGSLAALVAFTGVFLALASFVVGDPSQKIGKEGLFKTLIRNIVEGVRMVFIALTKALNSFRRFIIYGRKKSRETIIKEVEKEIIKEVPVEKIVTTEVPVETIKKELVYVPMYTNDKALLNMSEVDANQDLENQTLKRENIDEEKS